MCFPLPRALSRLQGGVTIRPSKLDGMGGKSYTRATAYACVLERTCTLTVSCRADGSQDLMASDPLLASLLFKLNTSRDAVAAAAAGPSPDGGTAHGSPSPSSSRGKATCVNMELVKLWLLDFRELQLRKEIGEGSFGKVASLGGRARPMGTCLTGSLAPF
jgi:hypothetical protein